MYVSSYDVDNANTNYGWESSREIVQAILEMAVDENDAQCIWEDPTSGEAARIEARAWELADSMLGDVAELHWGERTLKHP